MIASRILASLRLLVGVLLGIHGVFRALSNGAVANFGEFLVAEGIPVGTYAAAAITGFEILGALLLVLGWRVRLVASVFAIELAVGILLVHAREGWFVVGGGRNGVEYSVLLIGALLAVAAESRQTATTPPRSQRPE